MAGEANITTGTLLAEKYRVLDLLGEGGMGAVYLAENVDIGRQVAVKVLKRELAADPSAMARFRQEARAAAAIGHPGIVEVLDMGMLPDGGAFIVMERLEGQTLREHLARQGSLGPGDLVEIIGSVLETLAAAHDKGVIHRDLKPDNIFLADRPVPATKILDFGISKFRGSGDVGLTRTGTVMGTPLYMSPEQARGAKDVGITADIYSVGAILYEALSGQPPFPGESYNEVLAKVLMDTARPIGPMRPDVPQAMAELIEGMLSKDPTVRPPSARAAASRLRASAPPGRTSPRGTSSTFIGTPPAVGTGAPASRTGPKPLATPLGQSGVDATYTPPPQTPRGTSPTPGPRDSHPPPNAAPIADTMARPPQANANHLTQPASGEVAVRSSRALIGVVIGLAVLLAIAVGVLLGQRTSIPPPGAIPTVTVGPHEIEIHTPLGTFEAKGKNVGTQDAPSNPPPTTNPATNSAPPNGAAPPTTPIVPANVPVADGPPMAPEPRHPKPIHSGKKPKGDVIQGFGDFKKTGSVR